MLVSPILIEKFTQIRRKSNVFEIFSNSILKGLFDSESKSYFIIFDSEDTRVYRSAPKKLKKKGRSNQNRTKTMLKLQQLVKEKIEMDNPRWVGTAFFFTL